MYALCVEASHAKGMGHLFRSLVIAEGLEQRGQTTVLVGECSAEARFVLAQRGRRIRDVSLADQKTGWIAPLIRELGIRVWINDRLDTDASQARSVKAAGARLATFDDYGEGGAAADLNISASPRGAEGEPRGQRVLSGLRYVVLNPSISRFRRVRDQVRSRVVSMGGSDTYGLTVGVLQTLREAALAATVVLGPGFRHHREIEPFLGEGITAVRPSSLPEEFAKHDLAITAGGMTLMEACAAGLPCVVIAAEPWEAHTAQALAQDGACIYAGFRQAFDRSKLLGVIPVDQISRTAMELVDLRGADRVLEALLSL